MRVSILVKWILRIVPLHFFKARKEAENISAWNTRTVHVALCRFDSSWMESSWTLSLYSPKRCLHLTCCRAWRTTTQRRNWKSLILSLSLSFSLLSSVRFTHIHPWLLLTYFSPSPLRRRTSLYTLHASEKHAWSRTVTHDLSRTHVARSHAIHQDTSRALRLKGWGRKRLCLFSLRD